MGWRRRFWAVYSYHKAAFRLPRHQLRDYRDFLCGQSERERLVTADDSLPAFRLADRPCFNDSFINLFNFCRLIRTAHECT